MAILFNDSVDLASITSPYDTLPKDRILTSPLSYTELTTVNGNRFYSEFDAVFGNGEVKYIYYKMPTTADETLVFLQNRQFKSLSGDADLEILWDSTGVVAGTPLPIFNENRNLTATSNMEISEIAAPTTDGTIRERDWLVGSGTGSNSSGDISPSLGFRMYSPDSFFIAKISNLISNDTNRIRIAYSWLEVPSSDFIFT